jgi:acyl-CoA synthetase (AMP-forming)/AMP-acid ligase II
MTTPQTIAALFSHQATSQPGSIAMITPDGDATYGEILDRSSEYAGHLLRMGARKGTVLGLLLPNCVGGLMWSFVRIIAAGGTFVTEERLEARAALKLFTTAKVDTVTGWDPVIEQLTTHPDFSTEAHGRITGLAPLDPTEGQPSLLGMTETFGPHSGWMRDEGGPHPAESVGSLGRALEGIEHRVVDPATRIDVPAEQVGELLVRGDSVMHGLHRREGSEDFTPDGWYPPRDAVALSDGWLFFDGRLDDLIKTSGANVSPAEVKAVLESSEAVRQAFVVGVPHPSRGADVVAFIVAEEPALDMTSLLDEARRQLAAYKVPRRILRRRRGRVALAPQPEDRHAPPPRAGRHVVGRRPPAARRRDAAGRRSIGPSLIQRQIRNRQQRQMGRPRAGQWKEPSWHASSISRCSTPTTTCTRRRRRSPGTCPPGTRAS